MSSCLAIAQSAHGVFPANPGTGVSGAGQIWHNAKGRSGGAPAVFVLVLQAQV